VELWNFAEWWCHYGGRHVVQYTCGYWMAYQATVTGVASSSLSRLQMEFDMVLLRAVDCILSAQRSVFASHSACLLFKTYFSHHQCHVAGEGRSVIPAPWPLQTVCFQSSTTEQLNWSSHLFLGRPGWHVHSRLGGTTDRGIYLALEGLVSRDVINVTKCGSVPPGYVICQWKETVTNVCVNDRY